MKLCNHITSLWIPSSPISASLQSSSITASACFSFSSSRNSFYRAMSLLSSSMCSLLVSITLSGSLFFSSSPSLFSSFRGSSSSSLLDFNISIYGSFYSSTSASALFSYKLSASSLIGELFLLYAGISTSTGGFGGSSTPSFFSSSILDS